MPPYPMAYRVPAVALASAHYNRRLPMMSTESRRCGTHAWRSVGIGCGVSASLGV